MARVGLSQVLGCDDQGISKGLVLKMDHDKFNKIASGIQALVVAIAVVIGGIWTLYTFASLNQIEKASADLEQSRRDLRERGILDIKLEPKQISNVKDRFRYITIDVTLHNTGNRTEIINWDKSGIAATQVNVNAAGQVVFGMTSKAKYVIPGQDIPSSSILPGQIRKMPFLITVKNPGIFYLVFHAAVSPLEEKIHEKEHRSAGIQGLEFLWQSATYFSVE